MLNDRWYYFKLGRGAIIATQSQDLRGGRMRSSAAARLPLFVCRFCPLRDQKRHTDNMGSTMLPQAEQRFERATAQVVSVKLCEQCVDHGLAGNFASWG